VAGHLFELALKFRRAIATPIDLAPKLHLHAKEALAACREQFDVGAPTAAANLVLVDSVTSETRRPRRVLLDVNRLRNSVEFRFSA
jgi:hypothetical protein